MTSPGSTGMDMNDFNPRNLPSGIGSSTAHKEAEPIDTASQSLEISTNYLASAMQSLEIQAPGQEQQQFCNPFTESLKNSITYAEGYAASKNPNPIEANAWLSEIDKLDGEMSMFTHEMSEGRLFSKEAFDLIDQMLCMRQEVLNLVDQSFKLGQKFGKLRQRVEDSKQVQIYLPGLTVSFKENEELKDAIWDLKCLVERHVDILEKTRKKQVALLIRGSMLQSQLDSV